MAQDCTTFESMAQDCAKDMVCGLGFMIMVLGSGYLGLGFIDLWLCVG